jgi:hypothetical protein
MIKDYQEISKRKGSGEKRSRRARREVERCFDKKRFGHGTHDQSTTRERDQGLSSIILSSVFLFFFGVSFPAVAFFVFLQHGRLREHDQE